METAEEHQVLIESILESAQYRVYPDTPLSEVVDLIVRRGLHVVPVVGDRFEVLGLITSDDALEIVLSGAVEGDDESDAPDMTRTARDVMTRTVLCVAETQPVSEAGRIMLSRKVDRLPVVRDGELIGLVTREAVLRALRQQSEPTNETLTTNES